jgi:outer membrane receptor protein involved in Fe transport
VRSDVLPELELRASWAEGFALPNTFAKYALGAADLDPNVFRQTEVGMQWKPRPGISLDVAAYRLTSSDEIRTVAPGVYENYGETRRTGVEISALWAVRRDLDLSLTYGSANAEVTASANPALVGKRVAAVPRHATTASAAWSPLANWTGTVTWRRVGSYAVNADNSIGYGGYNTVDLGLTWRAQPYQVYATVANVNDKVYASTASLIGGTPLFAPGAPRTLKVGVQMQF